MLSLKGRGLGPLNWTSHTIWVLPQFLSRAVTQVTCSSPWSAQGPWAADADPAHQAVIPLPLFPQRAARPGHSGSDGALFPWMLWGSTNHASQTLYLLCVVIFEEIMTSGFYLFILCIYFAFVECICLVKMGLISLWEFHLKTGSQRLSLALNGAHLEGPPWTVSEISCWDSCYLASIKKPPLKWDWKKEDCSGRVVAQIFPSHFSKTSLSSGWKEPIGLLRMCCQLQGTVLKPMAVVNADRW